MRSLLFILLFAVVLNLPLPAQQAPPAAPAAPAAPGLTITTVTTLDVPHGANEQDTRAAVIAAMNGHILGKAVMVGLFKRPQ